jgi:hypothetical protein
MLMASSILFIIGWQNIALNSAIDLISTAGGGSYLFTSCGSQSLIMDGSLKGPFISTISSAIILALFISYPITPLGAAVAGGSMLVGCTVLEYCTRWKENKERQFFEIFLRQMPKSIGAATYILLSMIPGAVGATALVAIILGILMYYYGKKEEDSLANLSSRLFFGISVYLGSQYIPIGQIASFCIRSGLISFIFQVIYSFVDEFTSTRRFALVAFFGFIIFIGLALLLRINLVIFIVSAFQVASLVYKNRIIKGTT